MALAASAVSAALCPASEFPSEPLVLSCAPGSLGGFGKPGGFGEEGEDLRRTMGIWTDLRLDKLKFRKGTGGIES